MNYPPGIVWHQELNDRAPMLTSQGPVWVDVPSAGSSHVLKVLTWLKFPDETATYCLLSHKQPQQILHANTLFVFCQAVSARKRSVFVPYPIRMCVRPGIALTIHGAPGHNPQPLQRILPGLDRAIDGGERHFTSSLLREIAASYVQVLEQLSEQLPFKCNQKGQQANLAEALERRLVLFSSLLCGQKTLLNQLSDAAHRFLDDGSNLLDELMIMITSAEIRSREVTDFCRRDRQHRMGQRKLGSV